MGSVPKFPNRADIDRYRKNKTKVYAPLIRYFTSQGYRYIDLLDTFEKYAHSSRLDELFSQYHYSPAGNALVAQFILKYLNENKFTDLHMIQTSLNTKQSGAAHIQ
jgi:hypothetical protein